MKRDMRIPSISRISIKDPLFGDYLSIVSEKIVPYQWEILNDRIPQAEKSYCVANFKIAAGRAKGKRQGVVFSDTDIYKWLETVSYCIENGTGQKLQSTAEEAIELIGAAQEPDGYLNTYYTLICPEKKWSNLCEGHELYCAGHLIEAAVAYLNATGKRTLLDIACKFADLIYKTFEPEHGTCKGYPGHQEIELALVKLYRITGEKTYLQLAKLFIQRRGTKPNYLVEEIQRCKGKTLFPEFRDYEATYAQTHLPAIEQTTAEGHAVRAMYMYAAMADLAKEDHDEQMKAACFTLWDNVVNKRMYITGGIGSSGHLERFTTDYDLPNDRMYCESCASIGLMMFGQRMTMLTRDAKYFDIVERALCNTVLAGISKEGDRYFYVNPLEVWPQNCIAATSMAHVKPVRQKWFSVACCPPNIARTLASIGQYIYAEDDKSIYVHQFISSALTTEIEKAPVQLDMNASFMQDGKVTLAVNYSGDKPFTIRVRIPAYYKNPVFKLNGKAIQPVIENNYAVLAVSRSGQQLFELAGTVEPQIVAANVQVRADVGRGAIMMGPYVYCLEQTDNGENLPAIYMQPTAKLEMAQPLTNMPGSLPTLTAQGTRITQTLADDAALYGTPALQQTKVSLKAVPYCLWGNRTPGEMLVWIKQAISLY